MLFHQLEGRWVQQEFERLNMDVAVGDQGTGLWILSGILEPATTLFKVPAELPPQAATPFVILWQVEVSTSKACTLGLLCTKC